MHETNGCFRSRATGSLSSWWWKAIVVPRLVTRSSWSGYKHNPSCMFEEHRYFSDEQWVMLFTQPLHLQGPVLDTKVRDLNSALQACLHRIDSRWRQLWWNQTVFTTARIWHCHKDLYFLRTLVIAAISTSGPFLGRFWPWLSRLTAQWHLDWALEHRAPQNKESFSNTCAKEQCISY